MWRAGGQCSVCLQARPAPLPSPSPPPGQWVPHCSRRRKQPDPLGQGDPTSSVTGIVLSASESNVVALFCQRILEAGPGEAGLGTLVTNKAQEDLFELRIAP